MQVYNMLIVDDEPYIVHSLSGLLASQPDLELNISYAYCAEEALQHMGRQRIDILLSDIQMKELSGIDLVKIVKDRWPMCKALLITAHTNFEYIYEAYNYDVTSYILKTESDEHIVAEVKKAIRLIEENLNQDRLVTSNQNGMRDTMVLVRRELFFSLMNNNSGLSDQDQTLILRTLGYQEPIQNLLLITGILQNDINYTFPGSIDESVKSHYTVKMIMSHYLTSSLPTCCCETKNNRLFWLLQPKADVENFAAWVSGMLETVQQSCYKTSGIQVSFVLSSLISSAGMIPLAYHKGNLLANQLGIMQRTGFVFSYDLGIDEPLTDISFNIDVFQSKLNTLLENDKILEFHQLLESYCEGLKNEVSCSDISFAKRYYSLALYLLRVVENRKLQPQVESWVSVKDLLCLYAFESVNAAVEYIKRLYVAIVKAIQDAKEDLTHKTIHCIKEYVESHIFEDISLQRIAEVTSYNISYLSRLFSKRTGMTLSSYIAQRKLESIKDLMLNANLTLNDIMLKSGFDTRSYFNRFIKRWTGLTPHDFRKKLINLG